MLTVYGPVKGMAHRETSEPTRTILPPGEASRGKNSRTTRNAPITFTSSEASMSASAISTRGPPRKMPAQQAMPSRRAAFLPMEARARATAAAEVTSMRTGMTPATPRRAASPPASESAA